MTLIRKWNATAALVNVNGRQYFVQGRFVSLSVPATFARKAHSRPLNIDGKLANAIRVFVAAN